MLLPLEDLNSWELRTGNWNPIFHWIRSVVMSGPAPSESFEGRVPLKSSREDPQRRSGESQEAKILNFSKIPAFSHHFPMLWMMCPYFVKRCQQLTGCFLLHPCSHSFLIVSSCSWLIHLVEMMI